MLHIGSASAFQAEGVSSILIIRSHLSLAQWIEYLASNQGVVGSSPTGETLGALLYEDFSSNF